MDRCYGWHIGGRRDTAHHWLSAYTHTYSWTCKLTIIHMTDAMLIMCSMPVLVLQDIYGVHVPEAVGRSAGICLQPLSSRAP